MPASWAVSTVEQASGRAGCTWSQPFWTFLPSVAASPDLSPTLPFLPERGAGASGCRCLQTCQFRDFSLGQLQLWGENPTWLPALDRTCAEGPNRGSSCMAKHPSSPGRGQGCPRGCRVPRVLVWLLIALPPSRLSPQPWPYHLRKSDFRGVKGKPLIWGLSASLAL